MLFRGLLCILTFLKASLCLLCRLYLKEEHRVKKGRELDSTKWTHGGLRPAVSHSDTEWLDKTKLCIFISRQNESCAHSSCLNRRFPSRRMVVIVVFLPVNMLIILQKEDLSLLSRYIHDTCYSPDIDF